MKRLPLILPSLGTFGSEGMPGPSAGSTRIFPQSLEDVSKTLDFGLTDVTLPPLPPSLITGVTAMTHPEIPPPVLSLSVLQNFCNEPCMLMC
jgi:hypothetical protein